MANPRTSTTSTPWKPTATFSTRTSSSNKRRRRFGASQRLAHRREAAAVLRARAVRAQGRQVRGRRIDLVQVEAVLRPGLVQLAHEAVAGDLGEDRGGHDRTVACVAADPPLTGAWGTGGKRGGGWGDGRVARRDARCVGV